MSSAVLVGAEGDQGDDAVRHLASIRRPFSILMTRRQVMSKPIPFTPVGLPNERRLRCRKIGAIQRTQRERVRYTILGSRREGREG